MDRITKILAFLILVFMFFILVFSSWNDSATFDEIAHIPAGYSYLKKQDYRLNPEHPPLIKDLAALPLLFLNLNFRTDIAAWNKSNNDRQWEVGSDFLYESGNNPDQILHFSRLAMMLLSVFFGWLIFYWTRKKYGDKVGLLTLFFYAMSPTIIAHARYVTTDIGAGFGFFLGLIAFLNFLENQTKKNLILAGLALGLAALLKFSIILLIPTFFILAVFRLILEDFKNLKTIVLNFLKITFKLLIIGFISLLVIWPIYQLHVLNYPPEIQLEHTEIILGSLKTPGVNLIIWLSDKPFIRGLAQYFLGVAMVIQRSGGGNNFYFLGEVSSVANPLYFPLLYLVKELLPFHILALIALILSFKNIISSPLKKLSSIKEWLRKNFILAASLIFISIYLIQAITGNLNIGVRHIIPALPFIYFLTAKQIVSWLEKSLPALARLARLAKRAKRAETSWKKAVIFALLLWISIETLSVFPFYLSYYNELAKGTKNGYKIATDSNYDWGQDLKRLKSWIDDYNIDKIYLDYFGGGSPKYYLGEKFEPWWSAKGQPTSGWFAVSINQLEGARAKPIKGFQIKPEDTYSWLKDKQPLFRAGTSIFIYRF